MSTLLDYYSWFALLLKQFGRIFSSEKRMVDMYCSSMEHAHYSMCDLVIKCDLLAAVSAFVRQRWHQY